MNPAHCSATGVLRALWSALRLSLACSFALPLRAHAATIHSTIAGGPWAMGSTWIGGIVPTAADDVVLDGPVTVQGTRSCAGLGVAPAGALRNGTTSPATLVASGAIANSGVVEDGPQVFRGRVGGDLHNEGVWTNGETILTGAADHHLTQSGAASFESHLTRDAAATGALFLDTPFAILGNLDQDGGRVVI